MPEIAARGIDVSYAQGVINWEKVKENVDFAIIRSSASYPHGTIRGVDLQWVNNIRGATAAGMPIGAYHYLYALTPEDAKLEAAHFLRLIQGYRFEYPVALDLEEPEQVGNETTPGLPPSAQMDLIDAFLKPVEAAGYYVVLYTSASVLNRLAMTCRERLERYDIWAAHVYVDKPGCSTPYGMWQYSWKGRVPGIRDDLPNEHAGRDVDLDYAYRDYPSMIKAAGLNGWGKQGRTVGWSEAGDILKAAGVAAIKL